MPQLPILPRDINNITPQDTLTFACHKGVSCFTECCRMLELALTPYDVLRLRKATGLSSRELLDQYIIEELEEGDVFPQFYLTMVDDGRASCAFVSDDGCTVYEHRPAACRTYPLGRATVRKDDNAIEEHFVIMREKHCLGFKEDNSQSVEAYNKDQGMEVYNRYNDAVAYILQHEAIRKGIRPTKEQIAFFTLALYDLDTFREQLFTGCLESITVDQAEKEQLADDEQLLLFAIEWMKKQLDRSFSQVL